MKLLIVARHFPPAVSGGARRPYQLARELIARGHEVRVIAPAACADVPVVVVAHHHVGPDITAPTNQAPGLRERLRRWMLPDPDIRWALRASRAALPFTPDWVHTTSPPESSHVAGWLLKRRFGCRWSADFRDHWFDEPLFAVRRQGGVRVAVERMLARFLLRRADALTATTEAVAREASAMAPSRLPVAVIEHAADPPSGSVPLESGAIHIVHTGSFALSDPQRTLRPVLEGFAACGDRRLRLHLVGRLRRDEQDLVAESADADRIVAHGPLDFETARAYQASADILLLVTAPDTPHVPGKLAEYRATGKPIIAIGGGSWQQAVGIGSYSDASQAFRELETASPATVRLTPAAAAERYLELVGSIV